MGSRAGPLSASHSLSGLIVRAGSVTSGGSTLSPPQTGALTTLETGHPVSDARSALRQENKAPGPSEGNVNQMDTRPPLRGCRRLHYREERCKVLL
ncbi:hypothetical protein NQZ68_015989 [Dissostichus eleginoides]|nr:hypothetical protein NQZ68_015989 [Dissostichus eleginoides]